MRILAALALCAMMGCGGDDGDATGATGCEACADNGEVCVVTAEGDFDEWAEACAPMPAECAGDDPCGVTECVAAMYDLCDAGYIGESYSCSGAYVSVTCSPDA